jgi:hypothetical protein
MNIINHDAGDKFEVTVGLPLNDGGADHASYKFVATCFPAGASVVNSTETQTVASMNVLGNNLYSTTVQSPTANSHTCKVDAYACSIVGCGTECSTSWNIGLNSATQASLVQIVAPANITVQFQSAPEPNKAINPKTTEIRWIHYVNDETFDTTDEVAADQTMITGNYPTPYVWSQTAQNAMCLTVFLAGGLIQEIERRHCYDDLCGTWESILTVLPVPMPGIPVCAQLLASGNCLKTTTVPAGGSVRVQWLPPPFWGMNSIQRGRAYQLTGKREISFSSSSFFLLVLLILLILLILFASVLLI